MMMKMPGEGRQFFFLIDYEIARDKDNYGEDIQVNDNFLPEDTQNKHIRVTNQLELPRINHEGCKNRTKKSRVGFKPHINLDH